MVGGSIPPPRLRICLALILGIAASAPASAQVAATVAIDSDYRVRGYSLTDDHAALSVQVSYDDPSGAYASLSGLTRLGNDTRFLGLIANAGYAKRISHRITLDAGLLRSQIGAAVPGSRGFKYTEVYAGAYAGPLTGRIYYSPDYRTGSQSTLYGELEAGFEPLPKWRLSGHVGLLTYLTSSLFYPAGDTHHDWRVSVARQLGKVELHAALSQGGPNTYYGYREHRKVALTVGASASF